MALTSNRAVLDWIDEMAAMTQPDQIVWIDGSEAQLEELRACYQQFLHAVRTGDMEEIKATDLAFHRYVIRMAGNDLFEVLYDFCHSLLEPFFIASGRIGEALPGRENIVDEQRMCDPHYQMLEAIETRDRAKAEQAYQAVLSISGLL